METGARTLGLRACSRKPVTAKWALHGAHAVRTPALLAPASAAPLPRPRLPFKHGGAGGFVSADARLDPPFMAEPRARALTTATAGRGGGVLRAEPASAARRRPPPPAALAAARPPSARAGGGPWAGQRGRGGEAGGRPRSGPPPTAARRGDVSAMARSVCAGAWLRKPHYLQVGRPRPRHAPSAPRHAGLRARSSLCARPAASCGPAPGGAPSPTPVRPASRSLGAAPTLNTTSCQIIL